MSFIKENDNNLIYTSIVDKDIKTQIKSFDNFQIIKYPNIDDSVEDKDFVYLNIDGKYYKAIADGTEKQNVIGMYSADDNIIITSGIVSIGISSSYGQTIYLSDTNPGKPQISESGVKLGISLGGNYLLLSSLGGSGIANVSDIMLISVYDSNNNGKVDNAEYADVADKLVDITNVSDIMLKSVYDSNNNGKVDNAEHADVADSLSNISNFMLKSDYDFNNDGKVDNAEHALFADTAYNLEIGSVVTVPNISGPTEIKYNTTFTLTASGSLTAFKDNGASIDHYEWILPNGNPHTGNSVEYTAPDDSHIGESLRFSCRAVDTLGNKSNSVPWVVMITDSSGPIIDNIEWSNSEFFDSQTYTVTISAHHPDGETIHYKVTCEDINVSISPSNWSDTNTFDITFPDYSEDTTVTFTFRVKDDNDHEAFQSEDILVHSDLILGETAVTAGGTNDNASNSIEYVVISTLGCNGQLFGNLSVGRHFLGATSNGTGDVGVFAGGSDTSNNHTKVMDYITITTLGNVVDVGELTKAGDPVTATSNGTHDKGIFVGVINQDGNGWNGIDYVTISTKGNASPFGELSLFRFYPAATSNGTNDIGIIGGGHDIIDQNEVFYERIDWVNIASGGNTQNFGNLTLGREFLAATSNGTHNRGIFAGGRYDTEEGYEVSDIIDCVNISSSGGNATSFGNLISTPFIPSATSNGINNIGLIIYYNMEYITINTFCNGTNFGTPYYERSAAGSTSNA